MVTIRWLAEAADDVQAIHDFIARDIRRYAATVSAELVEAVDQLIAFHAPVGLSLAAEVLSPSTARVDRYRKRALYQAENVPEFWIVDVDSRIERRRPGDSEPEVLLTSMTWQPVAELGALRIDLVAYFRAVRGEWGE